MGLIFIKWKTDFNSSNASEDVDHIICIHDYCLCEHEKKNKFNLSLLATTPRSGIVLSDFSYASAHMDIDEWDVQIV
jgi:hypothetical protein